MAIIGEQSGMRARLRAWVPEREIVLRSGTAVRFLRISTGFQVAVVGIVCAALLAWGAVTIVMLVRDAHVTQAQARLQRDQADVASRSAKVDAYSRTAAGIARDIERRQHLIEELVTSRLGPVSAPSPRPPAVAPAPAPAAKTGALLPDADQMRRLEVRQSGFARELAAAFDARSKRMETQLRGLGLDPQAMLAHAHAAQGGPLEALPDSGTLMTPALRLLADSVARLGVLEDTLVALPSGVPTLARMVTSSYGVRRDPFTGQAAFHPGIDFVGSYGQQIMAAAGGTVAFVGQRNGYGNCVEIDHGHGIMTRYGHLSGFVAHAGETVTRGQAIARMGSTGRSTGTHLHFEVRVDGRAINPRPFLEAREDGFDVQQDAGRRPRDATRRG